MSAKRNGQNIFTIGMFIVNYFQYCFWGRRGGRVKSVFVYFRLPLRMFHSLLQSIDNQNVLGRREEGEREWESICPKCSVEVPCCLVYVPKRTHAVFKSNISSDKDYIRTSFLRKTKEKTNKKSCEYLRIGGHFSVQMQSSLFSF